MRATVPILFLGLVWSSDAASAGASGPARTPEDFAKAIQDQAVSTTPAPRSSSMLDDLRIGFHAGSATMTARGESEARAFAAALNLPALAGRRFEIAGHTDASGAAHHNLALSRARAEAVRTFLVAGGVARGRLQARGYGSERPALPDAPNHPANRRVEARSLG